MCFLIYFLQGPKKYDRNNPKGNWIRKWILSKQAPGPCLLLISKQQDQGNMIKTLKIFIPFMQCAMTEFHFSTTKTLPLVYVWESIFSSSFMFHITYARLIMLLAATAISPHFFLLSCFPPALVGLISGQNFSTSLEIICAAVLSHNIPIVDTLRERCTSMHIDIKTDVWK